MIKKQKILVLDVCGTIVQENTTFKFLDIFFNDNRLYFFYRFLSKNLFIKVFNKVLCKMNFDLNRKIAIFFLRGYQRSELKAFFRESVYPTLTFNQALIDVIKYQKEQGLDIVLLSASLDFIVEVFAEEIAATYYASSIRYFDGISSGFLERDLLLKKEKILGKIYSLNQIVFISDNKEDVSLLKKVAYGFFVVNERNRFLVRKENLMEFSKDKVISIL